MSKAAEDEWCLKIVLPPSQSTSAEANTLDLVKRIYSVELIERELANVGLPPLPKTGDKELRMAAIAVIDACRITIAEEDSLRIWIDCVRLGSEYLLIGGCSSQDEQGIASLKQRLSDSDGYIAPILSSVLEVLKQRKTTLYSHLLEGPSPHVIPMDYSEAHKVKELPDVFVCSHLTEW